MGIVERLRRIAELARINDATGLPLEQWTTEAAAEIERLRKIEEKFNRQNTQTTDAPLDPSFAKMDGKS